MKKSLVLASLLTASSLMAADIKYFGGVDYLRSSINGTFSSSTQSYTLDGTNNGYKIKVGAIIDNNHRTYISYNDLGTNDYDFEQTFFNYDYLMPLPYKSTTFLLGAHIGNAKYDDGSSTLDGLAYGVQTGFIYDFTKNISLELGLAYTKFDLSDTVNYSGTDWKHEIDDSTSFTTGINFKF